MIGSFKSKVCVADKNLLIWNELNLSQVVKFKFSTSLKKPRQHQSIIRLSTVSTETQWLITHSQLLITV